MLGSKLGRYFGQFPTRDKPFKYLIGTILLVTHVSSRFNIGRPLYKIRFFPESSVAAQLWINPEKFVLQENLMAAYLHKGDIVVDVGANIGTITLPAAKLVGPSGRVFSVEAHPRIIGYLRSNAILNHLANIDFFECAVGASEGMVRFSNYKSDSGNQITPEGPLQVRVARLDSLLQDYGLTRVDFLKIDVEGFEKQVLEGARQTLAITNCIYTEVLDRHLSDYDSNSADIFHILRSHGFMLYRLENDTKNVLAIRNIADFLERARDVAMTEIVD